MRSLKRIAGGEDQHPAGFIFSRRNAGEKMQPVFIRQAEIQHDQAVMIAGQRLARLRGAVETPSHTYPSLCIARIKPLQQQRIVFND
ncbi:Uncharacterised protein [Klebsiella pneumoniae]|uniref:Uncharacterized protein n=1 Tax=Klebsiella pneumoniae TaxID=573 RepID=A0A377XTG5_KLEPN|nr:Uncharacterised protein [Klebsiella pneumoniae]